MKLPVRHLLLAAFCVGLSSLSVAAKSPPPAPVIAMGNDTFSIVRQASSGFDRDIERLKDQARDEAEKYCTDHGKKLKVVSLTADRPKFALGYASAKIVFRAADINEVEPAPGPPASPGTPSVTSNEMPTPTGNLYNDLLKLDDLRKRGLLSDKEFESEKKKALRRSQ